MFCYLPEYCYADNMNYIRLSTNFPFYHRNIFGLYKNYRIDYIDSDGIARRALIPFYNPANDTLQKPKKGERIPKPKKETKRMRKENLRSFKIDSAQGFGLLTLNSFSKGHFRKFFRTTFGTLKGSAVKDLVIDLRADGGGDMSTCVLLTKYIRSSAFKVSDSSSAISKTLFPYMRHIKENFFNSLGLFFLTHKKADGRYHFGYWERHFFKPKQDHFTGNVYVLINGFTFSASTLFCNLVKGQQNVKLVGEQAGGGWYGNSGIFIPDIILPNTRLHVRLPLFRIVQYNHITEKGSGVMPDIYIGPESQATRQEWDLKMEQVRKMISKK